jgi:hypothetical protein
VFFSFSLVQPVSEAFATPIPTLVVKLDSKDSAIQSATTILSTHLPGAVIVKHKSFSEFLMRFHPIQQVIFVGHGYDYGVMTKDGLLSWVKYAEIISLYSASAYHLLNCNSNKVLSELPTVIKDRVAVAFGLDIDARIAALISSLTVHVLRRDVSSALTVYDKLTSVAEGIMTSILQYLPLGYIPNLHRMGWTELGYWIVEIVLVVLPMVIGPLLKVIAKKLVKIGGGLWTRLMQRLGRSTTEVGRLGRLISKLSTFWTNWGDFINMAWGLFSFFRDYFDYLWAATTAALSWLDLLIWGVSLLAQFVCIFVTGGWSTVLTIVSMAWDVYRLIGGIYTDLIDYGDYPYTRYGNH